MKKSKLSLPIVILKTKTGYSAFSPAVSGCIATGKSIDDTIKRMKEALEFHLEGEMLVKHFRNKPHKVLKRVFEEYGTDALYASIEIAA